MIKNDVFLNNWTVQYEQESIIESVQTKNLDRKDTKQTREKRVKH